MFIEIRLATHKTVMNFDKRYINVNSISKAWIGSQHFTIMLDGQQEIVHPEDVRELLKAMGFTNVKLKGVLQEVKE